jgi:hypothetical protein
MQPIADVADEVVGLHRHHRGLFGGLESGRAQARNPLRHWARRLEFLQGDQLARLVHRFHHVARRAAAEGDVLVGLFDVAHLDLEGEAPLGWLIAAGRGYLDLDVLRRGALGRGLQRGPATGGATRDLGYRTRPLPAPSFGVG